MQGRTGARVARGRPVRVTVASVTAVALTVVFVALLVVAARPLNPLDERVTRELFEYTVADPGVTWLLVVWTELFGPWTWRVVVLVLAVWLWRRERRGVALWAAATIVVGGLIGWLLKVIVDRERPVLPDPVAFAPGDAFPSGHALNVTLGAGILLLLAMPRLSAGGRAAAWAGAVFLIVSVAYTRVALGVHWVSDVLGGIVLGVALLAVSVAVFESRRLADDLITP
ncbi:MAG TPA: phosphatase PAP2 family protein [Nonomuraea sp.]|nr:phosphatase PAP2 family protein [Nonomuraea sp.]